jgi:biopolymer transport protein ExbB
MIDTILHIVDAGGMTMYPLIALAIVSLIVIFQKTYFFYAIRNPQPRKISEMIQRCATTERSNLTTECLNQKSPVSRCFAAVLQSKKSSETEIKSVAEEVFGLFQISMDRYLGILDTTTTISPLLGLLGTIVGMIGSFQAMSIARAHGASDEVLNGVAEALYATATGICIAVVSFIAYNFFTQRIRTMTLETEQAVTALLNSGVLKKEMSHEV